MAWARIGAAAFGVAVALAANAQDGKAWLESQGLDALDAKTFQEFEVVVAKPRAGGDAASSMERVAVLRQGKPVWQSGPHDSEPGTHWTIHSIGRDLNGDGTPDLHLSAYTGGANCCTTHHVYQLKPQFKRLAVYSAGAVSGGEFIELPGRRGPVMISADDSSANAFAPYANSYFPAMILEVGPKGRMQFAGDLMQSRLPGQAPPVCGIAEATANAWLRERCAEYTSARRRARTDDVKAKLAAIKSGRAAEKLKWDDYFASGVLAAVSSEMNRYAYTGHGNAAYSWLETVWPGNDAIKVRFVQTLRMTQSKSAFAEDLRRISTDNR